MNNNINKTVNHQNEFIQTINNHNKIIIMGTEETDIKDLKINGNSEFLNNGLNIESLKQFAWNEVSYGIRDITYRDLLGKKNLRSFNIFGYNRFIFERQGMPHNGYYWSVETHGQSFALYPTDARQSKRYSFGYRVHENTENFMDNSANYIRFGFVFNAYHDLRQRVVNDYSECHSFTSTFQGDPYRFTTYPLSIFNINLATNLNNSTRQKIDFELLSFTSTDLYTELEDHDIEKYTDLKFVSVETVKEDDIDKTQLSMDSTARLNMINQKIIDIQNLFVE